jgi:uncharacterized RDD family membrane protein YckC
MKCPKCGYLGFEAVDRCRNCGYDFSLVRSATPPELPLREEDDDGGPLADLALLDAAVAAAPDPPQTLPQAPRPSEARSDTPYGGRAAPLERAPAVRPTDLPLFAPTVHSADDAPLITRPSPPRPPLAVRRASPEIAKVRPLRTPMLDLEAAPSGAGLPATETPAPLTDGSRPADAGDPELAPLSGRLVAVTLDLGILILIDALVVYFTMQICGLTLEDAEMLPKGPLVGFLAAQNAAYFVAFTAGGQTLGKMAAGIKVVSTSARPSLDLGRSLLRTFVWVLLAAPAGLGFLTAFVGRERRGLHDRCAGTRVVRAAG